MKVLIEMHMKVQSSVEPNKLHPNQILIPMNQLQLIIDKIISKYKYKILKIVKIDNLIYNKKLRENLWIQREEEVEIVAMDGNRQSDQQAFKSFHMMADHQLLRKVIIMRMQLKLKTKGTIKLYRISIQIKDIE